MKPRLRSMIVDATRTILVLDRVGDVGPEQAARMGDRLTEVAERSGLAGGAVFGFEVELPDDEPAPEQVSHPALHDGTGRVTVYVDPETIDALRWAIGELAELPVATDPTRRLRLLRDLLGRLTADPAVTAAYGPPA